MVYREFRMKRSCDRCAITGVVSWDGRDSHEELYAIDETSDFLTRCIEPLGLAGCVYKGSLFTTGGTRIASVFLPYGLHLDLSGVEMSYGVRGYHIEGGT